jgi:hypothetical protein
MVQARTRIKNRPQANGCRPFSRHNFFLRFMVGFGTSAVSSGLGAGIVMESIALIDPRAPVSRIARFDAFARDPRKLTIPCLTDNKCHALRDATFSSAA